MTQEERFERCAGALGARIARNMVRLRGAQGLTRTEAARKIGVSRKIYERWETGVTVPSAPRLMAAARFMGWEIKELLR